MFVLRKGCCILVLPVLRVGSSSRYVSLLQINMNGLALNYNGFPISGYFDERTSDAVKNFQDRFQLNRDGIVGPLTWKVLIDNVMAVQKLLNTRGYSVGAVDGWFGPATTSAVQRFQRDHGLYPSGIIEPRTRRRLFDPNARDNYETRMSSSTISSLHPRVEAQARRFLELTRAAGMDVRIYATFRSWDEQDRLFAQGRWAPGQIVTNARGGDSYHNWGFAFDAAPFENDEMSTDTQQFIRMGRLGQQAGLEWGGTFISLVDYPHFQNTFGLNTWDLLNGVRPPA